MQLSTQDFLQIDRIKDGIIILKNRGLRAVLMASSLNFSLKSEETQEAIIYQFQNFLNSLDFSCQILVQSRRLNIIGYLDKLKEIEKKEKNELLKIQIAEYHKFIEGLIAGKAVMQKTFYLIVPFSSVEIKGENSQAGKGFTKAFKKLSDEEFERAKMQLLQRVEFAALGLRRTGVQSVLLNTLEVIELLWSLHHPLESERGYHPEIPPEISDL